MTIKNIINQATEITADHWSNELNDSLNISPKHRQFIIHPGSLTKKFKLLQHISIQHRLISAGWNTIHDETFWVRQTEWLANKSIWVQTQTLIPKHTARQPCAQPLLAAKENPIGEILFDDFNLKRMPFEFASFNNEQERSIARRSIFEFHTFPLLITEIFTENFFSYEHLTA